MTRGSRNEPMFDRDIGEWTAAMEPVLSEAAYSALELYKGTAGSKVVSHLIIIKIHWDPRGLRAVDRFEVASASLLTVAEVEQLQPDYLPPVAEQIAEFRKLRNQDETRPGFRGASFGRVLLYSNGIGVNAGLRGGVDALIIRLPEQLAWEKEHDPGWVETLKAKKVKWGYEHE
ncbi:hypothetical protein RQP46_002260 [Phenoliferia psychrophenolica]